jgi:hypothetical protein
VVKARDIIDRLAEQQVRQSECREIGSILRRDGGKVPPNIAPADNPVGILYPQHRHSTAWNRAERGDDGRVDSGAKYIDVEAFNFHGRASLSRRNLAK